MKRPRLTGILASILPVLVACACASRPTTAGLPSMPIGKPVSIQPPLGLPDVPVPPDNPLTAETIALGEKLFFSTRLSADGSISCATCHNPAQGFADRRAVSPGVAGRKGTRNAPTVVNAAFNLLQFWDGRATTLEAQAEGPILNPVEMAHTLAGAERCCDDDAALRRMFEAAFGPAPPGQSPVSMPRIAKALAAYERTLLRANSPFDRYQFGGDKTALSAEARRGLAVFQDAAKGNCAVCHTIEKTYALFIDHKFHNLGVGMNAEGELTDLGRFDDTRADEDRGAFRTPTLRNIAETAPYMHDGSMKTLKEVVDFYVGGGNSNPHLDKEIKPLSHLTKQERADLVAFLESLTGAPAK